MACQKTTTQTALLAAPRFVKPTAFLPRLARLLAAGAWAFGAACSLPALAADDPETSEAAAGHTALFDIERFAVSGSKLLAPEEIAALVAPFTGKQREYGDIQRALEAIEESYRSRGYAAVQVYAPEQEITAGVIRLEVNESVVGKVRIEGDISHFDAANRRASLPALIEGETPNAQRLSAQVALANENPAKQTEVVLGLGSKENTVDATIKAKEENPLRLSFTLDTTGSRQTGRDRSGVAIQHANLWNRDHVATLAYQSSFDKPSKVDIYSLSYRIPVYALAGAFDFIFAKSTVNAGSTPTTAGDLSFAGSGRVFGLRYTQSLARRGDSSEKLVFGWDIKANDNTCTLGAFGAAGCGPAASDITFRPFSFTYSRTQVGAGALSDLSLSLVHNFAGGAHGGNADFAAARPSPTGGQGARASYSIVKASFSHLRVLDGDWQARLVANAQWTPQALLTQEQLGMAGNATVRGFQEREVARDRGIQINLEGYTPNFAEAISLPGNLRALAFIDAAHGSNHLLAGEQQGKRDLASWGLGLRYALDKSVSARLDLAQVLTANGAQERGDWRGHFSLVLSF